jgi:hypothetical protein
MKERSKDALKIEEALIRHRRLLISKDIPPFLSHRVMAHLRDEVMHGKSDTVNGSRVRGLVWRFAAVTCMIAVLLGVYGIRMELQTQYQFAEIMVDDASNLDFVQDMGVL